MLKRISLGQKLTLMLCLILILVFGLVNFLTLKTIHTQNRQQANTIASLNSKYNAENIEKNFEQIITIGNALSIEMESMVSNNHTSRVLVIDTMKGLLDKNKNLFGITVTYEPNAFDNNDGKHLGAPGSDASGQFMPYVTRKGNDFAIELSTYPYYDTKQMDWYNIPKTTQKIYLTEPITYLVQGKDVAMASVVVPILRNNRFVGVVSIDTSLEYLQTEAEKINLMGGFVEIVSEKGTYVANGHDASTILTPVKMESDWQSTVKELFENKNFLSKGYSFEYYDEYLVVINPIKISDTGQYWYYMSNIPLENIYSQYNHLFQVLLIVSLIFLCFIIYINYAIITRNL